MNTLQASLKVSIASIAVVFAVFLVSATPAHAQWTDGCDMCDSGYSYDYSYPMDSGYSYDYSYPMDNGYSYDYSYPMDNGYSYDYSYPMDSGYSSAPTYSTGYSSGGSSSGGCSSCNSSMPRYSTGYSSSPIYSRSPSFSIAPVAHAVSIAQPTSYSYPSYHPTPSYPTPTPVVQPAPSTQTQINSQTQNNPTNVTTTQNAAPINITNINTNTNTAPVTPVAQTPVQHLVQYIFPTTPTYNNVSCNITVNNYSVQNGQNAYLSWTSNGATSAVLSDGIGAVAPNGSLAVRPEASRNYVLTVYGPQGQTATCHTSVTVAGSAPYVSLSQIPYTGFDFGTFGNSIYWASLLSFAIAAAYLVVYYKGGLAFATGTIGGRRQSVRSNVATTEDETETEVAAPTPVAASRTSVFASLPTREYRETTTDAMSISTSNGEMPRIVITRA